MFLIEKKNRMQELIIANERLKAQSSEKLGQMSRSDSSVRESSLGGSSFLLSSFNLFIYISIS